MNPILQKCTATLVAALATFLVALPAAVAQVVRASAPSPVAAPAAKPATTPAEALKLYLEREATGLPGRVEVTLGSLDPRISFGECQRIEPFMPVGARLWGRGYIGVRCAEGGTFTAFLPVTVKVTGPALVAMRALPAGSAPSPADLRLEETELTREPPGALADFAAIGERVLTRPLAAGQMLRADYLRVPPAVLAGDTVKVLLTGSGFSVATEGRAMTAAAEGQSVRVQTALGKNLTGVARAGKVVQVGL